MSYRNNMRIEIMHKLLPAILAISLTSSAAAIAQTTPTTPPTISPTRPSIETPQAMSPTTGPAVSLTDAQAKAWEDKSVYSSDGKKVGEVAKIMLDSSGKVTELQADIGGFLGIGESRVRVMTSQFMLAGDRVNLLVNAEQAKTLPKVTSK